MTGPVADVIPGMLSLIVPVTERHDDLVELLADYRRGLAGWPGAMELIVVLDASFEEAAGTVRRLAADDASIQVVQFGRNFGEAVALAAGFECAAGEVIVTLPSYRQVEPAELGRLLPALADADVVVARRWPRIDAAVNRLQAGGFHAAVRWLTKTPFRDLGCGVRALRRRVAGEVNLYGDNHRFFPLLAQQRGFKVVEVDIPQSSLDRQARFYGPGVYSRRLLDLLSVFFLVKFTRKPLRFFGLIGAVLLLVGAVALAWIVIERLFMGMPLADRPALLLSTMFIVLGAQVLALGLIGELIIFTHASDSKEYTVDRTVPRTVPELRNSETYSFPNSVTPAPGKPGNDQQS